MEEVGYETNLDDLNLFARYVLKEARNRAKRV
jgi:hypothetical protein